MRRKILLTTILTGFALSVSGCGVKGELKTPPPIFGEKTKQQQDDKQKDPDQQSQDDTSDDNSNP